MIDQKDVPKQPPKPVHEPAEPEPEPQHPEPEPEEEPAQHKMSITA